MEPKRLYLRPLAPYEDRLLNALAFFRTKRKPTTQAHHCLSMYLRQSEERIMSEVGFYAHSCGVPSMEFLELLYSDPDKAESMIENSVGSGVKEAFDDERDTEPEAPGVEL
ncbi:hypothetical protein [Coleofasciculus sp.]|uniref:hypothetical protein n=1 Tax=Coleofasciculus sp. TaxID=3100458 RepID=UPI0039FA2B7C